MVLKYVLKNFSRRRVRTMLMILSLVVSMGLIVTMSATVATLRQSNIDLIVSEVGRADLTISKKDTSFDLTIPIADTVERVLSADSRITTAHPRIEIPVDFTINGRDNGARLIGLDSARDNIGTVTVKEGDYTLGNNQIAIYETTARELNLSIGDTLTLAYSIPRQREVGKETSSAISQRRVQQQFTISAFVVQNGVTSAGVRNTLFAELADLQRWLSLQGQALQLVATVDSDLYQSNNAEVAALQVREITARVQAQLGDDYTFGLAKASALSELRQLFQAAQALINTYGLISLAVVGLLVHTLVMTNVQEQRRDMAVLRILGSQRTLLFRIVIVEIVVVGTIGIVLGVLLGQLLTAYAVVPLMERQFAEFGSAMALAPAVTLDAILPPVISAFIVLILSGLKPANEASRTKVMHAINPGVADNIQLEDLTQLRERKPNYRLFLIGLAMMSLFALLIAGEALTTFGGPAVEVVFVLVGLLMLVLGLSLMFFITTIPFERLTLALMRLVFPRLTYFAQRNVSRGQTRNTLIAMLVLFSGVLPSFLATGTRMDNANAESTLRANFGAPVRIESFGSFFFGDSQDGSNANRDTGLKPSFVRDVIATVPGFANTVGLSQPYSSTAADSVGLRSAAVNIVGVDGDLSQTVFNEMIAFTAGGIEALQQLPADTDGVIISEGLATHLSAEIGSFIDLTGVGRDNLSKAQVIGIARNVAGFRDIGRSRATAQQGSTVLVSMAHFGRIRTELNKPLPTDNDPLISTVLATLEPDADTDTVSEMLFERFDSTQPFYTRFLALELEWRAAEQAQSQVMLLMLTAISFTTAVFGVFAVIYVTIFARRIEIGMLKAMGMLRRELTMMLILESIAMTLGSALAGIAAGASMGYLTYYGQNALREIPISFAVDSTVMPAIIILVAVASILGAMFSSRRIVRKQAVDILRM